MSPELQERILRSVRGDAAAATPVRHRASFRRWFRLLAFLAICGLTSWLTISYREQAESLRRTRDAVLKRWSKADVGLTTFTRGKSRDVIALVEAESAGYLGDTREEAPSRGSVYYLTRPAVYLRLGVKDAQSEVALITRSGEVGRDALLACLAVPPEGDDERSLQDWVRRIYSPEFREKLSQFHPASRLFLAMTVLGPEFGAAILQAKGERELARLDRALDQANLKETRPALDAELLILAIDEEKLPGTVTEIDGSYRHWIRLVVIDLASKHTLFRTREEVDPGWISEARRPRSGYSLTSCRFGAHARASWQR